MGIILALLLFSFIVFFHEFGHFLLAKLNGIDVDEFAIGMGPAIFSKEYKGTLYAIRILPIGGYCAMGEDDEATDSPGNFNNKPVWARISVIAAGAIFNFILAFIMSVIFVSMAGYDAPVIDKVDEGFPAVEAGIMPGDKIIRMNDEKINIFREITMYNQFHQGEETDITFVRDGEKHTVTLTPIMDEKLGYTRFGFVSMGNQKATVLTALQYGAYEVGFWIETTLDSLKMLITGKIGADQLSGPVGIVDVVGDTYEQSKEYGGLVVSANLLSLAILLSANLGVMNLLPLPALDGGRLVFLFIEAIRGKRVPPEKEGYVHGLGMLLLLALMVFVMYNDIVRLIAK